ncbi:MAG: hypothetical protein M1831_000454 [Alyxoria varia]|nr:MAG: hypothetical protein M1831_000454 [Alyxoria varia]
MPSGAPRFFANDQPPSRRDPRKQLVASLTRLVRQHSPDSVPPGGGLYYGPCSIAYLFFALNQFYNAEDPGSVPTDEDAKKTGSRTSKGEIAGDLPEEFTIEGIAMGTWFAVYLKQAQDAMRQYPGPRKDKCGVSDDIMSMIALSAASAKDPEMARELCDYAAVVTEEGACNEWLYGRAGYLYLLRMVRATFSGDDPETTEMIDDTADEVIECILKSPRPWKWHDKTYVGAVHGAIGIITQIVLTDPTYATELEPELGALLSYQFEGGNWPSSIPPGKDRLVQFCHGAPGVITSLLSIRRYFPKTQERIDKAVRAGREAIKERGLLTKESCLCHGISGNALALEGEQFEHFLTYTTAGEMKALEEDEVLEKSKDPSALFCGEAGRAWAWAVADKGLDKKFLGYNDL